MKKRGKIVISTLSMWVRTYTDIGMVTIVLIFAVPFLMTIFDLYFWGTIYSNHKVVLGLKKNQLLTYILLANIFYQQFNIYTPATTSLWEGSIIRYYTKPVGLIKQFILETIGKSWIPNWVIFSLPTIIFSRLLEFKFFTPDINCFIVFILSLTVSIVIGFEIDIIFSAIAIKLKNGCWAAQQIRNVLILVLSGQFIPLQFFPKSIYYVLRILPFGSLTNAPISIYLGIQDFNIIFLQCFWAIFLGYLSYNIFKKTEEEMISLGG